MTSLPVEAAIYSTATGALLRFEPDELAQEWKRLRKLPLPALQFEMPGDRLSAITTAT